MNDTEVVISLTEDIKTDDQVERVIKTRIRIECDSFLSWRWRWLLNLYISFFLPLVMLAPSKPMIWVSMNFAGFIYVAAATCERKNPFSSRKTEHGPKELIKLLIASPIMYFIGPHWTLVDSASTEPITIFEGFGQLYQVSGFTYYVLYTYFCYITPFFIGLHFTYLDYFPFLQRIVLNKHKMKRFGAGHWFLLLTGLILVLVLSAYQIYLYYIHGRLEYYAIAVGGSLVLFSIYAFYQVRVRGKYFHLHHYNIGQILILFTANQNVISAFCQGIAAGVYVEGVTRWSMADLFKTGK